MPKIWKNSEFCDIMSNGKCRKEGFYMILNEFKCVETDVNLDEYLKLYSHVRNFM